MVLGADSELMFHMDEDKTSMQSSASGSEKIIHSFMSLLQWL